jgi:hypothetical protein
MRLGTYGRASFLFALCALRYAFFDHTRFLYKKTRAATGYGHAALPRLPYWMPIGGPNRTPIDILSAPDELRHGDIAAFEPSSKAVEFEALTDTEFVLGSAAPHEHDLVLGHYSVHTSPDALRDAEAHISAIRTRLVQEGRL